MDSQGSRVHICGIIGGMSYLSSSKYPVKIHSAVNAALGDCNCAKLMTYDVNFQEIRQKMTSNDWEKISEEMVNIAE